MASLKEVKARIASVNSTLKITSAMKMVASAKLHRAQAAIENMLPYERKLHEILEGFLSSEGAVASAYAEKHNAVERVAVVAVSSNSSLCGAFNGILITRLDNLARYYQEGGRRRTIVDNAKRDQIENYESSNDAYVVEDYDCVALIENIVMGPKPAAVG